LKLMIAALLASIIPCGAQTENTSSPIQNRDSYPKYFLMGWNTLYFLPYRTTPNHHPQDHYRSTHHDEVALSSSAERGLHSVR
jgi:hypothetical protein